MKVKWLISVLIVACIGLFPAFAHATSDISVKSTLDVDEPIKVIIEDNQTDNDIRLKGVSVTRETVTPQDANGLKAIMLELIGDYETVVTDYTYQSGSSGYYSHSISIERDWSWIFTCSLFIVVIYCVFRAVGGILSCK